MEKGEEDNARAFGGPIPFMLLHCTSKNYDRVLVNSSPTTSTTTESCYCYTRVPFAGNGHHAQKCVKLFCTKSCFLAISENIFLCTTV